MSFLVKIYEKLWNPIFFSWCNKKSHPFFLYFSCFLDNKSCQFSHFHSSCFWEFDQLNNQIDPTWRKRTLPNQNWHFWRIIIPSPWATILCTWTIITWRNFCNQNFSRFFYLIVFENHNKSLIRHFATFTFWVAKSSLKMLKIVNFGEFLKNRNLRSNSVTRQVNFNRTKIVGKW